MMCRGFCIFADARGGLLELTDFPSHSEVKKTYTVFEQICDSEGKSMENNSWDDFFKTGKVSDYIHYSASKDKSLHAKYNNGEIKPALAEEVGKSDTTMIKPSLAEDVEIKRADQDGGPDSQDTGL